MDEVKAACHSNKVGQHGKGVHKSFFLLNLPFTRVLNTLKTIVTDDDILEKDDMHILDCMKEMLQNEEVMRSTAAKQLVVLIERAVRFL